MATAPHTIENGNRYFSKKSAMSRSLQQQFYWQYQSTAKSVTGYALSQGFVRIIFLVDYSSSLLITAELDILRSVR